MESKLIFVLSGFLCEGSKIRASIEYFRAHSEITFSTFRDKLSDPFLDFLTFENRIDILSRNVGYILPLYAT